MVCNYATEAFFFFFFPLPINDVVLRKRRGSSSWKNIYVKAMYVHWNSMTVPYIYKETCNHPELLTVSAYCYTSHKFFFNQRALLQSLIRIILCRRDYFDSHFRVVNILLFFFFAIHAISKCNHSSLDISFFFFFFI